LVSRKKYDFLVQLNIFTGCIALLIQPINLFYIDIGRWLIKRKYAEAAELRHTQHNDGDDYEYESVVGTARRQPRHVCLSPKSRGSERLSRDYSQTADVTRNYVVTSPLGGVMYDEDYVEAVQRRNGFNRSDVWRNRQDIVAKLAMFIE